MKELIEQYEQMRRKLKAFHYAMWMIGWDSQTEAPKGCFEERGKYASILSEENFKLYTSDEFTNIINKLYDNRDSLDDVLKHEIIEQKESIDKMKKIPMELVSEMSRLSVESQNKWVEAKQKDDYSIFEPSLEKMISLLKKQCTYLETEKLKGYNLLLDNFERGFTTKEYDEFFELLKKELVPFIQQVTSKKLEYNDSFEKRTFPREKQKEFCEYIQKVMCYDTNRGLMKESEHPFTSGFSSRDVRFTNHYYENLLISSIFSAIHELGHCTYEMQCDPSLDETFSGGGASMAMHESQSRFFENIIGRSKEFWNVHFAKLKETFSEELKDVTLDDFYKSINKVEKSLIRTEADELTYPIHIMIRYDIEKMIFNNEVEEKDLPQLWNKMYKDYLGVDVPCDAQGVLQDMHWSDASFGYFPTYALGSAYAAQMYEAMKKDINIEEALKKGTTEDINNWLKEKIHKYGSSKYPKEIFKIATGQEFDAMYYVNYLKDKYSKIYNI